MEKDGGEEERQAGAPTDVYTSTTVIIKRPKERKKNKGNA